MPIRDIVLTLGILSALPFCFRKPWTGVLVWTWLAFMNPHKLTWGFAGAMPFSQLVAAATLAGVPFAKDRRQLPREPEIALLLMLWALFVISTVFAWHPELAWPELVRVSKILLMTFITVLFCHTRDRLRALLLVTALSVGYYGFKGGIWGVVTGGSSGWVLGPEGTFIGDNNGLALAFNIVIPMLLILGREERRRWLRMLLYATFALSIVSSILTYSRGGFLGLTVVLLALTSTSRRRLAVVPVAIVLAVLLTTLAPERWFQRIETVGHYEEDSSSMARLNAWYVGWRLGLDSPLVGGGFWVFSPEAFARYLPGERWFNAHSIYFRVLGEHGFTGLLLFVALIVCTLRSLRKVRREAGRLPNSTWMVNYARMLQASVLGYLVNGTFQNHAYFDLTYLVIVSVVVLKGILREAKAEAPEEQHAQLRNAAGQKLKPLVHWGIVG